MYFQLNNTRKNMQMKNMQSGVQYTVLKNKIWNFIRTEIKIIYGFCSKT